MIAIGLFLSLFQAEATASEPAATTVKERKICRSGERRLGTRVVAPRRCKTERQWQEEDARNSGLPLSAQVTQGQPDIPSARQPQ